MLDGSPQVVSYRSHGRVGAGSPLPLYFDAQIPTSALRGQILAYEIGGGQPLRPFPPLAVRSRGHDPRVRVATGRMTWEAGAEPALPFAAINTEPGAVLYRAVAPGRELDREGRLTIEAAVPLEAAVRTDLVAEVEVTDRAGHSHAARRELVVFPAEVEVGIRRGHDWTDLGGELDAEAVVIDNDGEPVAGHPVEVRFLREGWHAWWEWSDRARTSGPERPAGYQLRRSQREEEVFRRDLTSEEVPVHCRFAPTRPGTYRLETRARDAAGREPVASRRISIPGSGPRRSLSS